MKVCCLLEVCNDQDMTQEISQLILPWVSRHSAVGNDQ